MRSDIERQPGAGAPSFGARLAYAGSPVALDYTEPGEHGALEVLMRFDESQCVVGVEPIKLDRRRVLTAQAGPSGCASPQPVDCRILHAFGAARLAENASP